MVKEICQCTLISWFDLGGEEHPKCHYQRRLHPALALSPNVEENECIQSNMREKWVCRYFLVRKVEVSSLESKL